jgi:hypothetical protein
VAKTRQTGLFAGLSVLLGAQIIVGSLCLLNREQATVRGVTEEKFKVFTAKGGSAGDQLSKGLSVCTNSCVCFVGVGGMNVEVGSDEYAFLVGICTMIIIQDVMARKSDTNSRR